MKNSKEDQEEQAVSISATDRRQAVSVDQVDLVCSQYVLAERDKGYTMSMDERRARLIKTFFTACLPAVLIPVGTIVFLMGLGGFFAWVYELANPYPHIVYGTVVSDPSYTPGVQWPLLYLFIAQIFFVFLFAVYRWGHKPFPTNIIVSAEGLSFAWRFKGSTQSDCISWKVIKDVSAVSRKKNQATRDMDGIILRLEIDKKQLSPWQTIRIWKETRALSTSVPMPGNWTNMYVNFPLDSLNLEADKFRLVSAIRQMAPESRLAIDSDQVFDSQSAPTYTELWLDDMQTFRRQSVSELPGETTLQDGRYKIIDKIATGGQAKLYRAMDNTTSTSVVLKELVLPVNAGADVRNRSFANVKKEALLLAGLDHPGILKLLDNFVEDHRAYLVFEYIAGRNLRLVIQEDGPMEAGRAAAAILGVCDILAYIHGQTPPVVHRDLSPDNLIITEGGKIVLLDFNFAQQLESNATRTVVGKHNYMAPEQFKGKPCPQSDLYSLGCTLYYLLTGRDPLPLSCSRPSTVLTVPAALDDVAAKLTTLDLASRYQSAQEAAADLSAAHYA